MQDPLVQQGIDLMIYGMGTVFVFLTLLVTVTWIMSVVMGRYFPEPEQPESLETTDAAPAVNSHILSVIQEAINQHRGRK